MKTTECDVGSQVRSAGRFRDALYIWEGGACNALAVSNALTRAIQEIRCEGGDLRADAAVKLIADHLCQLLGLPNPLIEVPSEEVSAMRRSCIVKVSDPELLKSLGISVQAFDGGANGQKDQAEVQEGL